MIEKKYKKKPDSKNPSFNCDHCDANLKYKKGFQIHVGKADTTISVHIKEHGVSLQKQLLLNLIPVRKCKEEVNIEPNICKLACTEWAFSLTPTSACSTASSSDQQAKWNTHCIICWTSCFPICLDYFRFYN